MSNIFIISAPSGCGKTSLVKELCHANISVEQTISYTTRKMRQGEENLKDYHFVSTNDFLNKIKLGHFIEYQAVYNNVLRLAWKILYNAYVGTYAMGNCSR